MTTTEVATLKRTEQAPQSQSLQTAELWVLGELRRLGALKEVA